MALFGFLLSAVVPLAKKILIGLGIGIVSFAGMDFVLSEIINGVTSSLNAIPSEYVHLVAQFKLTEGISIITAGFTTRLSMDSLKRFGVL